MKILIVDDHPLVGKGLEYLLMSRTTYEICGKASGKQEAIELIDRIHPDVVILDLRLQGGCGLEVMANCCSTNPNCKWVVLTSSVSPVDFNKAIQAGIHGYVLKQDDPEAIITAIEMALAHEIYISKELFVMVDKPHIYLSEREKEAFRLVVKGLTNLEIAQTLFISETTVKKHVSQIFRKLSVEDRTQLVLYAVENKLMEY